MSVSDPLRTFSVVFAMAATAPFADIALRMHDPLMMGFKQVIVCIALTMSLGGCGEKRRPVLSAIQAQQCRAEGGFESRAPFGTPMCQMRYADAGKICSGKSNCAGQCLSDAPENWQKIPVGTPIAGRCEVEKQSFGCYARVENGKLAEPYSCTD